MSYSRPAANAVDESWQGAGTYTRPAANASNESFAPAFQTTGFLAPHFGTPALQPVSLGWKASTFGTPSSPQPMTVVATGFIPVNFGVGSLPDHFAAHGFLATNFGTPALVPTAVSLRPVRFAIPQITFRASGWRAANLGTSLTTLVFFRAAATRTCNVGTPTSPTHPTVTCTGFMPVRSWRFPAFFYTGTSPNRREYVYPPFKPTHFGTPHI